MNPLRIYVDFVPSGEALDVLRTATRGHELVYSRTPVASVLAKAERDPQIATVDIAFGQPDPVAVLESPRLKWIQVSSSGITRYDTAEFRGTLSGRGIALSNSAAVYEEACATHVLSFMLAQARRLPLGLRTRAANGTPEWLAVRGASQTLRGQRVLIVGFGSIARRLATFLAPLGVSVSAHRRRPRGDEGVPVVAADGLDAALGMADHVVNILPESPETRGFFNVARFAAFRPGATFHNIGRGATVDQTALVEALRSGRVGAAWLDVTDPEPLPDSHPLWAEPNCFITPHVAGGHAGESVTLVRHFADNFGRFLRGEPLLDRVV